MKRRLPLTTFDFRKIRENNLMYIDKTAYIYELVSNPSAYFLARPRRFGKSMTIATLNELYSGNKELFEGLWIYDKWDWTRKHPVIRISFTIIGFHESGLRKALDYTLNLLIKEHNLDPNDGNIAQKFTYLISALSKKKKVVILIDEYDAPIVNYLVVDDEKAKENRAILKEFYTVLKEYDSYIELVFITGVSKFSKIGIFSGLNNLLDITMESKFATFLGYTQEELETNFSEEISETAEKMNLSIPTLLDKMRFWYNGYRFHHIAATVYNPISVNLFFYSKEFRNYWFQTGTPSFLINLLKKSGAFQFSEEPQGLSSFDTFDLEEINPHGLMYQTGYLTIKYKEGEEYYLDYPNYEVKNAMMDYLLDAFGGVRIGSGRALLQKIEKALNANDIELFISVLQTVFKKLPYFLHEKHPESFYHAAIHLLFTYMGLNIHSEVCTNDGRVDSLVETSTHFYIFEFKLDKSAEIAFQQIIDKQYYQAYYHQEKTVVGVGINFSSETKNISEWVAKEIRKN